MYVVYPLKRMLFLHCLQVQGGAASYRHNLKLLELFGFQPHPVDMRICFGVGGMQWCAVALQISQKLLVILKKTTSNRPALPGAHANLL